VTVESAGFRRAVATAPVRSAEVTTVNLQLEVGQVTEQVVVTDAVIPLDAQSAQVQESLDTRTVREVPVARNPNNFASTLPGIVPAPGGFNSGSFVSHGNRVRANNITIDNITATDISVAGTGSSNNNPLNFSSIKEVKIITNNLTRSSDATQARRCSTSPSPGPISSTAKCMTSPAMTSSTLATGLTVRASPR
jgi:hypothetical protein